ncbi:hypothetical protein H8E65_01000 [Candidatus Bathyarchaeota archaeon]|nr:hypothetical protein [Candidatus Bathyarchaeota archaeon]MBL7079999.1 hypothetical protein [Candidatus Bathyarchaeota archaeon]
MNLTGGLAYDTNYVPFGADQGEKGSEGFKYTCRHKDDQGPYYGARYYDSDTGRFIAKTL